MSSGGFLLDTGVFARFLVADDVDHKLVVDAVSHLAMDGGFAIFTPQVVRECWSVLTRPQDVGGFGLVPERAARLIEAAHGEFKFVPAPSGTYWRWLDLVEKHGVSGRQVHDAYLVASLLELNLSRILSFDRRDFGRYQGIVVIHPADVENLSAKSDTTGQNGA